MHALSTLLVALGLPVLALAIEGPEKLIYFDESCTKRERWNEYYGESNAMVESAARRLRSRTDTDYHTVVQRLFKITPADTENWNKLIKVMDALSGWETTDDLESLEKSTVRMYCDNDEHRFYNGGDDDARWQEDVQTIEVDGKDRVILDTDGSQMMQWIDFTK